MIRVREGESKDLDTVVAVFADDETIVDVDGEGGGNEELALLSALAADGVQVISLAIKDLKTVVVPLADDDVVVMIDGDPTRPIELAVCCAPRPK